MNRLSKKPSSVYLLNTFSERNINLPEREKAISQLKIPLYLVQNEKYGQKPFNFAKLLRQLR